MMIRSARGFASSTRKAINIEIDRSQLVNSIPPSSQSPSQRQKPANATPLVEFLRTLIEVRGPLTVDEYMKHCLTHPQYGYYTSSTEVFGTRGDFTTAPEIR